jgi:hypothetical protein
MIVGCTLLCALPEPALLMLMPVVALLIVAM